MLSHPFGWLAAAGLFFLVILAITVILSPVTIHAHFQRNGHNDDAEIDIKAIFGLLKYHHKIPIIKFTGSSLLVKEEVSTKNPGVNTWKQYNEEINADKVAKGIEKFKHILQITKNLKRWVKQTLMKVEILEWKWNTSIGTGDAMWTAMSTGMVWSVKTSILGFFSQLVKLKAEPNMSVQPVYQHNVFTTEWSCKAKLSYGHAILAAIQLYIRMKKSKGGIKIWKKLLFKA